MTEQIDIQSSEMPEAPRELESESSGANIALESKSESESESEPIEPNFPPSLAEKNESRAPESEDCEVETDSEVRNAKDSNSQESSGCIVALCHFMFGAFAVFIVTIFMSWKSGCEDEENPQNDALADNIASAITFKMDEYLSDVVVDYGVVTKAQSATVTLDGSLAEMLIRVNCRFLPFRDSSSGFDSLLELLNFEYTLSQVADKDRVDEMMRLASEFREATDDDELSRAFLTVTDSKGGIIGRTESAIDTSGRSIALTTTGGAYSASLSVEGGMGGLYILKFEDASSAIMHARRLTREVFAAGLSGQQE